MERTGITEVSDENVGVTASESDTGDRTLRAYERGADRYLATTSTRPSPLVERLAARLPTGAEILELGSGPGRDASALESRGFRVHRTDGSDSFVRLLRAAGHPARRLDVRAADYDVRVDAVFASAVLLHVARDEMEKVLATARSATRSGGLLAADLKRGEGEAWSTAKLDDARHFTYWTEEPLREVLVRAAWTPLIVEETTPPGAAERWITIIARNDEPTAPA